MASHSSPRRPSAPRFTPPRFPFAPAFAPAGVGGGAGRDTFGPTRAPRRPAPDTGPRRPDTAYLVSGAGRAPAPGTTTPSLQRPLTRTDPTGPSGDGPTPPRRTGPRAPAPAPDRRPAGVLRGRLAAAAVAAGALATAGHSLAGLESTLEPSTTELASDSLALASRSGDVPATSVAPASTTVRDTASDAATTGVLPVSVSTTKTSAPASQVQSLSKARKKADESVAKAAAAKAPEFTKPAEGRFTSGFGARWGTSHKGVDVANKIGTPIVSVADGVVTAAGPASGFGQWVKVRLADGTETVYGHVNRFFVSEGDKVTAGQRIAEIGNKGQSTGPHLHFEVHTESGKKINPLPWLAERGISLGAAKD